MLKDISCFNQIIVNNERIREIINSLLEKIGLDIDTLNSLINKQINDNQKNQNSIMYSGCLCLKNNIIIDYYHDITKINSVSSQEDIEKSVISLITILASNGCITIEGYVNRIMIITSDIENRNHQVYEIALNKSKNQISVSEKINITEQLSYDRQEEKSAQQK